MRHLIAVSALSMLALSSLAWSEQLTEAASAAISSTVSDPTRSAADKQRDSQRKPAETLAFAGVGPGQKIADYGAEHGYFTRLFAGIVGPAGHVYAIEPSELLKFWTKEVADLDDYARTHPNVTVTVASGLEGLRFPEKLDLFWIAQNYHDLHDKFFGPMDLAAFNRAVYEALRPGGIYIVLDHEAAKGAAADVTETLHRIEQATVRREVEAAGFSFAGQSDVLANPADTHLTAVFDPSIRGRTDQFILRFRKPSD